MKLLSESNPKTLKGESHGYLTYIMHLAPGSISGYNVCPGASAGCLMSCLNTAGRGHMKPIQDARIRKTRWFYSDRTGFMLQLAKDIRAGIRKAEREGLTPVFRLNGTSDIRWETVRFEQFQHSRDRGPTIFEMFPNVQFYDYTKLANRRNIPANYHLTFSRSESNEDKLDEAVSNGMNLAVVFNTGKNEKLPAKYRSLPVVDADTTDLRFLDPKGSVCGLRAKGKARSDSSGFVVHV